jgi:thiamine biosynthesis lipoprotein
MELSLSSWIPGSDISRLNERAGRRPVQVSEDTLELLQRAKRLSRATAGAFDVTVGAVWDIWPFRNRHAAIPSQEQIDQHVDLVDATSIEIDEYEGTAYLPRMGMKVNLGAIGKGYAAEIAIERMKKLGIERAAVSAGGDLYLLGKKTSGPWVVELEHPRWPGRYMDRFIAGDVAVATSGDAKQYVERDGRRYSHIIDPRTGRPANDCQSVTIVTQSPTEADAYATAVYVMGAERGMNWVEEHQGVEALIVDREGRAHRSSGWASLTRNGMSEKHLASSTGGL